MRNIKNMLLAAVLATAFVLTGYAAAYEWPNVGLLGNTQTVLYGAKKDEAIYFNCADLEFKLGLGEGELAGITVLSLPSAQEGQLLLDGTAVKAQAHISRAAINDLAFLPAKDAATATFSLLPEAVDSVQTTLSINLYDTDNQPPALESGSFSTIKNMPIQGQLSAYDADGDQVMIKLLTKPEKGEIRFEGASFTYEPFYDMTGKDEMTVVCLDKEGNYSQKATLSVEIEKERRAFSYADMETSPSHYSAVKLNEKGILTGEQVGDRFFFYPERQVTRGDFLMRLIVAAGLEDGLSSCVNTGLQNDSTLPLYLKPYLKLAKDQGILVEKVFYPDEILTRAEAVVLIDRAVGMADVKTAALNYPDRTDIPSWATQSYMNLEAYRMLDFYDGRMHPKEALTNDHMADLLWQVWKYFDALQTK